MIRALRTVCSLAILLLAPLAGGCGRGTPDEVPDEARRKELADGIIRSTLEEPGYQVLVDAWTESTFIQYRTALEVDLGRELTRAESDSLRSIISRIALDLFPPDVWVRPLSDIYLTHLDQTELRDLSVFYGTPLGRKVLRLQLLLLKEGPEVAEKLTREREREFGDRFAKEFAKVFGESPDIAPQDSHNRSLIEIAALRLVLDAAAGRKGAEIYSIADPVKGFLRKGDSRSFKVKLESGAAVIVVAGCDQDCADLDLSVVGPAGDPVAADEGGDARPISFLHTTEGGEYTVVISMPDCRKQSCSFAFQVLGSTREFEDSESAGTCFAVSRDGLVMTALHVVDAATEIEITFADGTTSEGHLIKSSSANDVALIRTARTTEDYLSFAPRGSIEIGTAVFTMGFPAIDLLGADPKYTEGSVSALSGPGGDHALLQVSVPIQPGNSGGPLLDEEGRVVGVMTATAATEEFQAETGTLPQNLNWAVKSEYAELLLESLPRPRSAGSREEAVRRARAAVCLVRAR